MRGETLPYIRGFKTVAAMIYEVGYVDVYEIALSMDRHGSDLINELSRMAVGKDGLYIMNIIRIICEVYLSPGTIMEDDEGNERMGFDYSRDGFVILGKGTNKAIKQICEMMMGDIAETLEEFGFTLTNEDKKSLVIMPSTDVADADMRELGVFLNHCGFYPQVDNQRAIKTKQTHAETFRKQYIAMQPVLAAMVELGMVERNGTMTLDILSDKPQYNTYKYTSRIKGKPGRITQKYYEEIIKHFEPNRPQWGYWRQVFGIKELGNIVKKDQNVLKDKEEDCLKEIYEMISNIIQRNTI